MTAKECRSWAKALQKHEREADAKKANKVPTCGGGKGEPPQQVNNKVPSSRHSHRIRTQRWERQLPKTFEIAAPSNKKTLSLPMQLKVAQEEEVRKLQGDIMSGTSGVFLDEKYVRENNIP